MTCSTNPGSSPPWSSLWPCWASCMAWSGRRSGATAKPCSNWPRRQPWPHPRPPQMAEMDQLYRRIGIGMGAFNVLLLGALYLMVFKP